MAKGCCGSEMCERKQAHGLRECALGGAGGLPRVPPWLEKWTALILDFIEEEQSLLPSQLLSLRLPAPSFAPLYTPAGAVSEARGALRPAFETVDAGLQRNRKEPLMENLIPQHQQTAARCGPCITRGETEWG